LFYFKSKLIKLTQPYFTLLNLLGGVLLAISTLLMLGQNSASNCAARPYMFNLGFTLAFSPLLIKAWRVGNVFNDIMSKKKMIPTWQLIGFTLSFLVGDVIILVSTLYSGGRSTGPKSYLKVDVSGAFQQVILCEYTKNLDLFYAEIAYKGFIVASACFMSYKVRNVAGVVADSKMLLAVVYNTAFITALVIIITQSIKDIETVIMAQAVGICFCVIMNVFLLVAPHIYQVRILNYKYIYMFVYICIYVYKLICVHSTRRTAYLSLYINIYACIMFRFIFVTIIIIIIPIRSSLLES
jgi:hypothetical protein